MRKYTTITLLFASVIFLTHCAPNSYADKLDVYGIGVGPKPEGTQPNSIDESQLVNVRIGYTPGIQIKEQDVSQTVKAIAGKALIKDYSGDPAFLAAWLNEQQEVQNVALLIDKEGVVAWQGTLNKLDVQNIIGVDGYKMLGGAQRITFGDAINKYVNKGKTQKYKADKKMSFKKGFFDYGKEGPFVYAKLPKLNVESKSGDLVNVNGTIRDGKSTLLIFFMSKKEKAQVSDMILSSAGVSPQNLFNYIEQVYFPKK